MLSDFRISKCPCNHAVSGRAVGCRARCRPLHVSLALAARPAPFSQQHLSSAQQGGAIHQAGSPVCESQPGSYHPGYTDEGPEGNKTWK